MGAFGWCINRGWEKVLDTDQVPDGENPFVKLSSSKDQEEGLSRENLKTLL